MNNDKLILKLKSMRQSQQEIFPDEEKTQESYQQSTVNICKSSVKAKTINYFRIEQIFLFSSLR